MALFRALITTVQKLTPIYADSWAGFSTPLPELQRASRGGTFKNLDSAYSQ